MKLMEKYQSMNKGVPENDEIEEKKSQKKLIETSLFKMIEAESEFDFIAIESREKIGSMYNEFVGFKK